MYQERAISKLQQELKEFQSNDNKAKAVKDAVADALIDFCKQDDEFAQAIVQQHFRPRSFQKSSKILFLNSRYSIQNGH